jgi:hypothetical protein
MKTLQHLSTNVTHNKMSKRERVDPNYEACKIVKFIGKEIGDAVDDFFDLTMPKCDPNWGSYFVATALADALIDLPKEAFPPARTIEEKNQAALSLFALDPVLVECYGFEFFSYDDQIEEKKRKFYEVIRDKMAPEVDADVGATIDASTRFGFKITDVLAAETVGHLDGAVKVDMPKLYDKIKDYADDMPIDISDPELLLKLKDQQAMIQKDIKHTEHMLTSRFMDVEDMCIGRAGNVKEGLGNFHMVRSFLGDSSSDNVRAACGAVALMHIVLANIIRDAEKDHDEAVAEAAGRWTKEDVTEGLKAMAMRSGDTSVLKKSKIGAMAAGPVLAALSLLPAGVKVGAKLGSTIGGAIDSLSKPPAQVSQEEFDEFVEHGVAPAAQAAGLLEGAKALANQAKDEAVGEAKKLVGSAVAEAHKAANEAKAVARGALQEAHAAANTALGAAKDAVAHGQKAVDHIASTLEKHL